MLRWLWRYCPFNVYLDSKILKAVLPTLQMLYLHFNDEWNNEIIEIRISSWHPQSSDKVAVGNGSHKTRIELVGDGMKGEMCPSPPRKAKKKKKNVEGNLVRVEPRITSKPAGFALPIIGDNTSEGDIR